MFLQLTRTSYFHEQTSLENLSWADIMLNIKGTNVPSKGPIYPCPLSRAESLQSQEPPCDPSGGCLACSLLPVWVWWSHLPWMHRKAAIVLGMQAALLEVCLNQGSEGQVGVCQSGNLEKKGRKDHAKEFRITWGFVSTGVGSSGLRGMRWSETRRLWANFKGPDTLVMSYDFKGHRKPRKVLVGVYYVPTIIF